MVAYLFLQLHAYIIAITAGTMGIVPRLIPYMISAFALSLFLDDCRKGLFPPLSAWMRPAIAAAAAFCAYAFLSLAWAPDFKPAFINALFAVWMLIAGLLTAESLARQTEAAQRLLVRSILTGAAFALVYLLIEFVFAYPITKQFITAFPEAVSERGKGLTRSGEAVLEVNPFFLNRGVAMMVLLLPVLIPAVNAFFSGLSRRIGLAIVTTSVLVITALSVSQTAQISLAAFALTAAAAHAWPKAAARAVIGAVLAAALLAVPLAKLPASLGLHEAQWIPYSARSRILIWDYTADKVLTAPLTGSGIGIAKVLQKQAHLDRLTTAEEKLIRRPGRHAHNIFLQIWFELGAIGAALFAILCACLVAAATHLHAKVRPFALGFAAAATTTAAFGWGMWDEWLIAGMVAIATWLRLLSAYAATRDKTPA